MFSTAERSQLLPQLLALFKLVQVRYAHTVTGRCDPDLLLGDSEEPAPEASDLEDTLPNLQDSI